MGKGYLEEGYPVPKGGLGVNSIQSVSRQQTLGVGNDTITHQLHIRLWSDT